MTPAEAQAAIDSAIERRSNTAPPAERAAAWKAESAVWGELLDLPDGTPWDLRNLLIRATTLASIYADERAAIWEREAASSAEALDATPAAS